MSDKSKKGKTAPPKLHKFMHPRNPYRVVPSFKNLAQKYAEFRTHCIYELNGKVRLNFKDPDAVRALTTCLLDQDFGLKVSIPTGRLVPTLPLRFNYLLWIEDLLTLVAYHNKQEQVIGCDVGCGSSCIYPLLAVKKLGWNMVATEADEVNFNSATSNVENNSLQDKIIIKKVGEQVIFKTVLDDEKITSDVNTLLQRKNSSTDLKQSDEKKAEASNLGEKISERKYVIDFTMCNPPFFSSEEETDSISKSKRDRSEPTSAVTGAVHEMVTEGGEVAFITQMMNESVHFKDRVRIFTTMVGSKAHMKPIKDRLKTINPSHTAVVEFCQGRTMRWGIAWTFDPTLHLENIMSKKQMVDAKPLVLMLSRSLMSVYTVPAAWAMINKWLHQLKLNVQIFKSTKYFVGATLKAYKPTWLHQRRKKRERQRKEANVDKKKENATEMCKDTKITNQNVVSLKRTAQESQDGMSQEPSEKDRIKRQKTVENKYSDHVSKEENSCEAQQMSLNDIKQSPEKLKDEVVSEDSETKLPHSEEVEAEEDDNAPPESQGGLECILKAKLHLKQTGGLITLEALYLRGSTGKDGLNQLLQYMRNRLTNQHT